MSSPTAMSGTGTAGPGAAGTTGPSPSGVARLAYERIMALAVGYERTGDDLAALATELRSAHAQEWTGRAAEAYRSRLDELRADLESTAHGYRDVAMELRVGAAGLSAQIAAVEQFLDLGAMGASVLSVLTQSGQVLPQHGLAGPLR